MSTEARPRELARSEDDEGDCFSTRSPAESIEWLIDNAVAYARLLQAVRGARRSVRITQLALDADCIAYPDATASTRSPPLAAGEVLAETLMDVGARGD